jgi:hypothetical protein
MSTAVMGLSGSIVKLFVPVGGAAFGSQVEDVPDLLDGAVVARVLPGVAGEGEHLRAPEVADLIAFAVKDVCYRELKAFG